jgi:dynein heavy chain, axonemal
VTACRCSTYIAAATHFTVYCTYIYLLHYGVHCTTTAVNYCERCVLKTQVIPVTAMVLRPHFNDMEYKLRPGMITLTWTSMNIDSYKASVRAGLRRLEELVGNVNDIIENRIEKNLKIVSKTLLVDLPDDHGFTVQEFVDAQKAHIAARSRLLQGKNVS